MSSNGHDHRAAHTAAWFGAAMPALDMSIEIFPARTPEAEARLWRNIELFAAAQPRFISVTCGAGGTGAAETFPLVTAVQDRFKIPVAAHLTCAYAPRQTIDALAHRYWEAGVRRIVALRGDAPKGSDGYRPGDGSYAYAADLVAGLKRVGDFDISVACYPEVHPEAASALADLDNLKRKVDAGANRVVTQYCFDTDRILRFRDALDVAGIDTEFVPGVMPIHAFSQIKRFSAGCGASIPDWLAQLFDCVDETSQLHAMLATSVAVEQCRRLAAEGIEHFHLYALNRAELPLALVRLLGVAHPVMAAA
ncbi:MAG: methylenetetrahydrofolate reductase [Geminicoccaceae bacterium]